MIDTPDAELGELGRLIKTWANAQRFPPSQRELARELGVSQQLVSNWMRGNYKASLKPSHLAAVARMLGDPDPNGRIYQGALTSMLRDLGLVPMVQPANRRTRQAR